MSKKGKSVRISPFEEDTQLSHDTLPLVPPPAVGRLNKKLQNEDQQPFYSIEMQQEDPFFYENDKHLSASNTASISNTLQNPFEPISRQTTLVLPEGGDYHMNETEKIIKELESDEEKQIEDEEEKEIHNSTSNESTVISEILDSNEKNNESSDNDFDWNDDPDQAAKPKRRKTAKERFQAAMKNPCCWHYLSPVIKRLIIAILGSCLFITIAVVIFATLPEPTEAQKADPNFKNIRSNVQCWMYWAAFMWHIFWVTTFMLDLVPSIVSLWTKLFKGRRSEKVKSYMEYYMSLKGYFCLVLLAAWNIGSWVFLINVPFNSIKIHSYSLIITKVFGCLLAASGLFFLQKTAIQIIAFKFHRTAFAERLKENKKSLKILDTLSKSEKRTRPGSGGISGSNGLSNNQVRKRKSPPALKKNDNRSYWATGIDKDEKYNQERGPMILNDEPYQGQNPASSSSFFSQFKKSLASFILAEKPTTTTGRVDKSKMDINSDEYAKKVAKKLFYSLAYPEGYFGQEDNKKCLDIYSFIPYFKDRNEAMDAFKVFDKDGNGDLTRREFRDTVVYIYRERKVLAQSIRDTSQALGKIDTILLILTLVITTVICLTVFSVDFWAALIPFGTILAACTFIFDTSASNVFVGIIFQLVTHPYDSGDLVQIDGIYMTVENIGILGTVFVSADGTKLYAPTTVLLTKIIYNVRRSNNMGETLTFNIDFRTENDLILTLRERLLEWVQSQSRDFGPGFDLRVTDIKDMNQVILTIWLPHKGNWADLGKRFQRKTRFMMALKAILTDLDIKYELPAQRITSSSDRNLFDISTKPQSFTQH
ncbi:Mechanosensitive ion channel-domain-containing protein [Cokeromyces recurvatus]|uniref:Mechanosensitive ion channel-domain-containing protein n=1 Tax=Cokeromyces recurvatus TaxID=90255 RepID=UPI00221EE7F1|nr:Mechanosensitive ion channel-domain-containing protein [Cokeromyces recurvatus]KAI7903201.1 Mechanosensitive ion channel-domain-containing protein [Cokeromyces recurvatus]